MRRILGQAKLDSSRVELRGKPIDAWANVVDFARQHGRLSVILAIVRKEYPSHPEVERAWDAYWDQEVERLNQETGAGIWTNGKIHDRIPADVHLIRKVEELAQMTKQQAQMTQQLSGQVLHLGRTLQPHRLRPLAMLSIYLVAPLYTALVVGGGRTWVGINDTLSIIAGTLLVYGPVTIDLLTRPGQYKDPWT